MLVALKYKALTGVVFKSTGNIQNYAHTHWQVPAPWRGTQLDQRRGANFVIDSETPLKMSPRNWWMESEL